MVLDIFMRDRSCAALVCSAFLTTHSSVLRTWRSSCLSRSSQASQTALLNLRQCPATAQESHDRDKSCGGQSLEKVPGCVVQEEDTLHSHDGTEEQSMGDRGIAQSLAQMIGVGAQSCPNTKQHR
jgi:hypothetical protein